MRACLSGFVALAAFPFTFLGFAAPAAAEALLWYPNGLPSPQARALLVELQAASDYGLDPEDYRIEEPRSEATPIEALDEALSTVALRFAHDLQSGRISPKDLGFDLPVARSPLNDEAWLNRISRSRDVAADLSTLEPPFLHYRLLKIALKRYRLLAQQPELPQLPPIPGQSLRPGDFYEGAPALRRLLEAVGDLDASDRKSAAAAEERLLDSSSVQALRLFQARHGLTSDGVLGQSTFRALSNPLSARVRQIELTLERWRWLPPITRPPIIINIPQFRLFAFHTAEDRAADISQMPVIVGRAFRQTRTPIFVAELQYVVFRPYWDVPRSIVRNEMLSPIRADIRYLQRNDLELVRGESDDGTIEQPTGSNIELLAAGKLRLRQRPGAGNALGLIKFVMPNDHRVYLHATPATHLFRRDRRDFSHGCIRLGDPVALAVHVLRANAEEWSASAIQAAMHASTSRRVRLATPVPVMILYATALAAEDGRVLFFDDIYGHDRRLDLALRARKSAAGLH